jgi:hypothetical protein
VTEDSELEAQFEQLFKLLFASMSEFIEERVTPDAQSYVKHFLGILENFSQGGSRDDFETEGTRFVKAYDNLHQKLKDEYLSPPEVREMFEAKSIGERLHRLLDTAIENRMNDIAAPAFDEIKRIVGSHILR